MYYLTMSIFWYFLFCLGFLLGLLCSVLFLFDIPFFYLVTFGYLVFFFQLSGAFLPVRVWAVQMGDKMFFLLFTGSAGRSSALKQDLFISFSILQLGFTITYVFFFYRI